MASIAPLPCALALGAIGVALGLGGIVATLTRGRGTRWHPIARLAVTPPVARLMQFTDVV